MFEVLLWVLGEVERAIPACIDTNLMLGMFSESCKDLHLIEGCVERDDDLNIVIPDP